MNFNRSNKFGGKRNFGGGGFNKSSEGKPMLYKATCDECNQSCEVPFKPSGNRPVLCSDCFSGRSNAGPKRFGGEQETRRYHPEDKQAHTSVNTNEIYKAQFEQLNNKLDKILKILELLNPKSEIQETFEFDEVDIKKERKKVASPKKASAKKAE